MTPGAYPLTLYRGDTYTWRFVLWTDEAKTIPADLVGVTVKAEIRDKPGGATIIPLACVVEMPNAILATLNAASSALLPLVGAWDLQLTYAEGEVATILAGMVTTTPDVTDSSAATTREIGAPKLIRAVR